MMLKISISGIASFIHRRFPLNHIIDIDWQQNQTIVSGSPVPNTTALHAIQKNSFCV